MYIVAQLVLLGVAIFFWRRYPRPSLYLAVMALLEVFGSVLQTVFQYTFSFWGGVGMDGLVAHSLSSLIRLAIHVLALFFLVMAVYVARRPHAIPTTGPTPQPGTPGMESGDAAFSLDPKNPYSPPRQPR